MDSIRKTARFVGVLFLLFFIAGVSGTILRGMSTDLTEVAQNATQTKISILLDLLANTIIVGIAVLLFPILKKLNQQIALWYFGFSLIGFAIIVVGNVSIYSLLTLSEEYVALGSPDTEYFKTMAVLRIGEYFGAHFIDLLVHALGASLFYYLLYRSKLLPRFISVWGFAAVTLMFTATILQIFDQSVSLLLYLPNGLLQLCIGTWLIIKGFNASVLDSDPLK